ncbi:MAG TPA: aminotransferase class I/II-fold pyridoxal phosphate-dependent enzyme, partial [Acidimicrobiales bacterium]|nr:aminotransferase class I/II-fold pyridoxal phosphate-dependent enzyme [Acidimicrobiales bacterium]
MPTGLVDLRSDTVTRPTPEMRRAMAEAEVGDDVMGEDPTVNALQEAFAERVGMEAALYVPSGTMANQLALRLLGRPGTTVVAGGRQHVVIYENAAGGRNAAVQFHTVPDDTGELRPEDVAWALEAARHHQPVPSLVCV